MPVWAYATIPWVALPAILLWRSRGTVRLDAYRARPSGTGSDPLVSIVVPARNEARNIARCLQSLMATNWPNVEIFVVDDHSSDGTGEIARRVARDDPRVHVLDAPPLPAGWFGKQWACHTAVARAHGDYLLFTDADTAHHPDALPLALGAMDARGADLLSVAGRQELGGFWERLLMPQMFVFILARYGNTETMSRSPRPVDKIANGQFFLVKRAFYMKAGGHDAVRGSVAEDLRLAQEVCRAGGRVHFVDGRDHLRTWMYSGLAEVWRGWSKNVYAGGRDTLALGPVGHALLRLAFPVPAVFSLAPAVLGLLALAGVFGPAVSWWALTCYGANVAFWAIVMRDFGVRPWHALLYPVGSAVLAALFATAAWRGDRVEWKGRTYHSLPAPPLSGAPRPPAAQEGP
jgi:chlorobactene glucosyltransferase